MQSRFPVETRENGLTAAPYSVFHGFAELFENFEPWLARMTGTRVHGHLFAPDRIEFSDAQTVMNGALSDSPHLRDYNPRAFLANLIWNTRWRTPMLPIRAARQSEDQLVHFQGPQRPDFRHLGQLGRAAL